MNEKYIDNWKKFSGKLLTKDSIDKMPDSLERSHILKVRGMLFNERFNADQFRVTELPVEGVYYFERALEENGVDYFSIYLSEDGLLKPQYTTIKCDKNGFNTFPCETIRESIDKHEC